MSGENPYQAPETRGTPGNPSSTSSGRVVVAVILGLLTLPAAGLAFFVSCLAVVSASGEAGFEGGFIVGGIVGLLVLVAMIFAVVRVSAGARRKPL